MATAKNKLIYQFNIALLGISPQIWRRIQVPERYSFWDLHVAIQDSLGWLDSHLHAFEVGGSGGKRAVEIGIPDEERDYVHTTAGWEVDIADHFIRPGVAMRYKYDFGDNWIHDVLLEGILVAEPKCKYPRCLAGERACPPEDCGGRAGYDRLMEILADRKHEEHRAMIAWLKGHAKNYHPYDPAHFDPTAVRFDDPAKRWKNAFS